MNFQKEISWQDFNQLSNGDKISYFQQEKWIFSALLPEQFDRTLLDKLYILTNKIRLISKTREGAYWLSTLLSNKKVMLYFIQPSTRTFLSFLTACQTLGLQAADVRSTETSSEVKGESFEDTIRTFSSYFDLIIMRHPKKGYAELASYILNNTRRPIPVINAGSGHDQHPTQALLDIFTLRKSFSKIGGLSNKTILLCGDLKRGRTVRSLCQMLTKFEKIKFIFCSPKEFAIKQDIKDLLDKQGIPYLSAYELKKYIPEADAVYMTRIQDEWDQNGESRHIDCTPFNFEYKDLKLLKPTAIIMHPLPRRDEIELRVDNDPRAMYWRQVRNGMWTRVALIAHMFNLQDEIINR